MVDDLRLPPLKDRTEFWSDFDWEKRRPRGRQLRDRGIIQRQASNGVYYILHIDEVYAEATAYSDELVRRVLTQVEEFRGRVTTRSESMNIELPLPKKKSPMPRGPDFF